MLLLFYFNFHLSFCELTRKAEFVKNKTQKQKNNKPSYNGLVKDIQDIAEVLVEFKKTFLIERKAYVRVDLAYNALSNILSNIDDHANDLRSILTEIQPLIKRKVILDTYMDKLTSIQKIRNAISESLKTFMSENRDLLDISIEEEKDIMNYLRQTIKLGGVIS